MFRVFESKVVQVVIELVIGFLLCFWAALTVPGKFLSIHPHSEENRFLLLYPFPIRVFDITVCYLGYFCCVFVWINGGEFEGIHFRIIRFERSGLVYFLKTFFLLC